MKYLRHLLDTKGAGHLLSRAMMIWHRFGLTRTKSAKALHRIVEIMGKHGCVPSFFITADLLDHHGGLIRKFCQNGVHVGLHGHHHIDHFSMSGAAQRRDIARGLNKFKAHNIPVSGFRGPFLRFNDDTAKAVSDNHISWTSHSVIVLDHNVLPNQLGVHNSIRSLLEDFYVQEFHAEQPSVPRWGPHCLEIPVSFPDDEMLVDRLGISNSEGLTAVWLDMLGCTRREGELLNLLFHPERTNFVAVPLDVLLKEATGKRDVWVTTLDDIAQWWQERATFSFEINPVFAKSAVLSPQSAITYKVTAHCNSRATVAVQHPGGKMQFVKLAENRTFSVHSKFRPVIAVSSVFCNEELHCLINDGFIVEHDADPSQCAFVQRTNAFYWRL